MRILLIDDTAQKLGRLKAALSEAGFEVIEESGLVIDLPGRVEVLCPDVILIDSESPGRDVLEQVVLVSRDQPRPIVMFTDEQDLGVMRQAIKSGVSAYIVAGIQSERLQPILDVAMARFESDQALRAELQVREAQLAERKRIERRAARQQDMLEASGRLIAVGEVASTLAHELNQPLGALSSFATGLLNRLKDGRISPDETAPVVQRIAGLAERASAHLTHRQRAKRLLHAA